MRSQLLMVLLIGCAAHSKNSPPPVDEAAVSDVMQHHRHHHHGGALMFVAMSLDTLGLPPEEQAQVEKIQSGLRAKMQSAGAAERQLVATLADGLSSSSLDRSKVDAAIAELETASAGLHEATIDNLNQLHAVLTPPQRMALVQKVEAHWDLWKQANGHERGHVAVMAKEIGLSDEQREKVHQQFKTTTAASPLREKEVATHLRDFGTAFQSEAFDAKTLTGASNASRHLAGWGATRLARFCEAVNPVLTSEQRGKLVELLREHLTHEAKE